MYFGKVLNESEYMYLQEGKIKDFIHKIFSKNKDQSPQKSVKRVSKEENYTDDIKVKVKECTSSDLKSLYNSDGIAIDGYSFSNIEKDERIRKAIVPRFKKFGCTFKDGTTFYIAHGKVLNKTFDLEGDNAYQDDYPITIISFNDCEFDNDINWLEFKNETQSRWWRDICDNNEYREYIKGRHKESAQIKWLIDAYGRK